MWWFKSGSKLHALHTLRAFRHAPRFAKRMECVQLAGAFELAGPYESGSKLHAVQTLRGSRTGLLAHDGLQALPQDGDQFFMGGVGFRVGQGALGASVSEGVGHAFLAWRNVLAPEDVEQLD